MNGVLKGFDLPPFWLAGFCLVGWGVPKSLGLDVVSIAITLGWGLMLGACAVMVWSALEMVRRRTTPIPHRIPSALVETGPFRFSRNPIYAADVLFLTGFGLGPGGVGALLLVPVFALFIDRRFIRAEEARLAETFPEDFADYAKRVRRWV